MFTILLLSVVFIASLLYLIVTIRHGYWRRRNIPGPAPTLFGGNIGSALSAQKSLGDILAEIYREYKSYPFVGIYKVFTPAVLVRDLDLVKQVLIKDFSNFGNNNFAFEGDNSLLGRNPFVLTGQEWKTVRQQLVPLLSSSKVKQAVIVFNESAQKMVSYVKKTMGSEGQVTLEAKTLSNRFTANNVASWGIGIDAKGFDDDPSDFCKLANGLFQFSFMENMWMLLTLIFPPLTSLLKISLLSHSTEKRFSAIFSESVEYRIKNNIERNDYLNGLLSLKQSSVFNDHDVISHIANLYVDGVESSAIMLHYVLYELAVNTEIQEKLRAELDEVLEKNNDTITFEIIQDMKYLDAVFNETLRLHLVLMFLDKRTTGECKLSGTTTDGKLMEVTLKPGTSVIIPLQGLHMDERYFPDPSAFNPERFFGKNKETIPKCSFMPFGEGPRACLGKTFGTWQVKTGVIYIIRNFKLSLGEGTPYPVVTDPSNFLTLPKDPIKIKFEERN